MYDTSDEGTRRRQGFANSVNNDRGLTCDGPPAFVLKMLRDDLRNQVETARQQHVEDLEQGMGMVWLPFALAKKYPNKNREFAWQWLLPSHKISRDPRSGFVGRHHCSACPF